MKIYNNANKLPASECQPHAKLLCIILSLGFLLSSCTDNDVEWIEVPLADNTYFEQSPEPRSETIEIPVAAGTALEYMLEMRGGDAVSYEWSAENLDDSEQLLAEFHGHTIRLSNDPGDLMFYKRGRGSSSQGHLRAPFDGIHGWYFSNESDEDIVVNLILSGFFELQGQAD